MEVSSTPRKEKKGLGKLWNKVKLAIRQKSKTKSTTSAIEPSSTQTPQPLTTQTSRMSQPTESAGQTLQTSQVPDLLTSPPQPLSTTPPVEMEQDPQPIPDRHEPTEPTTQVPSTQVTSGSIMTSSQKDELARRYERAQAIFAKYSLELDEVSWEMHPKSRVERVHKNPRMRVRWTCHECKTTFGRDRVCVECAHHRCKSCIRYPLKKGRTKNAKRSALAATADRSVPEVRDGACHECQTSFAIGSAECSNCHHTICERCLRESLSSAEQGESHAVGAA